MLKTIGSFKFIAIQLTVLVAYVLFQLYSPYAFDPYPFIFLNLGLSLEAAFMSPLLLIAANKAAERDREIAEDMLRALKKLEAKLIDELGDDE